MKIKSQRKCSSVPWSNMDILHDSWASAEFDLAQIRLIVYQDCEKRGRQVLFDSKAIRKLDPSELNAEETIAPPTRSGACQIGCKAVKQKETPPTYQYTRPSSDVNMLGEMMFGSVAMSYKGSTLKIHHIRSPPQLMVSKVFSTRCGSSNTGSTNTLQDSLDSISQTCPSHSSSIVHSNPVDMPGRRHNEDSDSGIARSASLSSLLATPLPSPGSSYSSGCASSYQRRWLRSQATSLQHGLIPRWSTDEMFSLSDESCSSNHGLSRRKKIAVSIIISLPEKEEENHSFQEFFFSHFPLFESHMNKLKTAIERAMIACRRVAEPSQRVQVYLCRVMEALGEFRMTVWNLYMAPRITEPIWLTMISQSAERNQLCQRFLREMSLLMEHGAKNQFLSSLLTAVLMYHLAWVPTVMPSNHPPIRTVYQKRSSQTVDLLAKSHPYNPLWAQLGDLYGALGSPVRVCRTVVVGRRRELVQRVLYVLSYFIRCSDLQENALPQAQTDSPVNPCPSQTTSPTPCSERTNKKPLVCESEATKSTHNPERTNDKMLTADTKPTHPAFFSEGTSTEVGDSKSADSSPFSEMVTDRLECTQECSGETVQENISANPSPPAQRVRFTIGSPKEAENDRHQDRTQPGCRRALHRKMPNRLLTDSLDSSDEEELSHRQTCTGNEMQQHELPLPSCDMEICPDVNHFGRSLLGGYSPQYMPDFVLHGVTSDQRLKQCLMADLEHTVLHPALDEPVAEAVCIVADTDRLCVQVATTQRRVCEPGQIGRDVMVSNLIHTLLTSVLQLHALNMAAEFCVMHLEDRLQEVYFKSCSLAEYLRGQRRVHVKELGLALGIESSDLPLLTAVASTHSPYVAQILL
ncbi:folliculin-interacting protein 2 isoform X2 [Neoarius graeffei]|uniref:folliculin-interacting protein 2 isoform X2 n=1 Tax=Neoarius graeffei TaxID=443677 RepID=UPI00298D466E|nr:folliculin-interacting protein 2 isoform X2 [Neoarius graeffei]